MKINGENFDFTKKAQEIAKNEIVENSDKRQEILFNIFDKNKDSKLSQDEITDTLNIFQDIDKEDETTKKKDEELSDDEILAAMKKLEETNPEFKEGKFELKEVKEMMVKFLKLNKSKAEAIEAPSEAPSAAPTEAPTSDEVKPSENPKDYVVPEGQSFKQLLNKILEKQGKTEPSEEDYKKAEEQFRKDNPDTEIRERNGVKYLLVGSKVKVPVDFGEELLDSEVEIEKWKKRVGLSKDEPEGTQDNNTKTIKGSNKYYLTKSSDGTIEYFDPEGNPVDRKVFQRKCPNIYKNANRKIIKGNNKYFATIEYDGEKKYYNPQKQEIEPEKFKKNCPELYKQISKAKTIKGSNGYYVYIDINGNKTYFNPKRQEIGPEEFKQQCPNIYKSVNKKS